MLDIIEIELRSNILMEKYSIFIDVYDNSLSRKWLTHVNKVIVNNNILEKNYCILGDPFSKRRSGKVILNEINEAIAAINSSNLLYTINIDPFTLENTLKTGDDNHDGLILKQDKFNLLHRWFEDLQGTNLRISNHYCLANQTIRYYIRCLNLLCHEYESWALSYNKSQFSPEWIQITQLLCWLNATRFKFEEEDYELFGIDALSKELGGVYMGINKGIGKTHWEIYNDEGTITDSVTSVLRSQTVGTADFDISWSPNESITEHLWKAKEINDFTNWLIRNGFDPNNKKLTIGHPQIGKVNLQKSFNNIDIINIREILNIFPDVFSIKTSDNKVIYDYYWYDDRFKYMIINEL